MNADLPKLPTCLFWGAVWGVAAWSAYAVVEFIFSSVVFRFTRPYALFPVWHWQLTALLAVAYLAIGLCMGALAGLAIYLLRRFIHHSDSRTVLEYAATMPLALALMANGIVILFAHYGHKGIWEALAAAICVTLLLAGIFSPEWSNRTGLLTNAWLICGLTLGFGQEFELLNMGVAAQLGSPITKAVIAVGLFLLVAAAFAIFAGRPLRRWFLAHPRVHSGMAAVTITAGLVLTCFSAVSGARPTVTAHASGGGLSTSKRPNIVLIVMDTVRADHLSVYGYNRDTSPNLATLARDSVSYTNAISPSDITLTSHASLFTGMYASWHSAYCQPPEAWYGRKLSDKYPTLAELLKKSGYETIGVAANLYLRADFGLERGFDEFRIPRPVPLLPDESRWLLRQPVRKALSYAADTTQFDRLYTMGEDIDDELFSVVERRRHTDSPFFVFVNYMDAHFPYVPPSPYTQRYSGRHRHTTQDELEVQQYALSAGKPEPTYREHCISQYDGGIAYVDAQVGRVIAWLKSHNAYDNTMIVVTSDHGESFGERNRTTHANGPYQNLLHVVLMVKYPKSSLRGEEAALASLTDVAPTILSAANVSVPSTIQGRNLAEPAASPREIYSETFPCPVIQPIQCPHGCTTTSVFRWPYKLIQSDERGGKYELFDLTADSDEKRNLLIREAQQTAALRADLDAWARPVQLREKRQLDVDKEKGLKDLGYAIGK